MPTYEYRCRSCKTVADASRPISEGGEPLECGLCGDYMDRIFSRVSFLNSRKQWLGRKDVNFEVDTRNVIAKKQAALVVDSGKVQNYFNKTKMPKEAQAAHMNAIGSMIKKAPPIKVDY